MTWYLILISLALFGSSNAVITKRSNHNQPNFQQYEVQTFGSSVPSSPLTNIIDAISSPLNILADRLTRQPGSQQFHPGYGPPGHQGPPGHFGNPGNFGPHEHYGPPPHRGPHEHRGPHRHHGQQQNNAFQHPLPPVPSFNPFLTNLPSRERDPFNREPMNINPQNPFLNKDTTLNSDFPRQPGSPFSQGRFPNIPPGQNYPKPGFSNRPGNANWNGNDRNSGDTGCIGFCAPPQPQQPNQFGNNGFGGNNFGGLPNNAQTNNGFGAQNRPSQGNGLIQSTFGGFGNDGNQTPQLQPTNQFGSDSFNNGGSPNTPQANNGFETQNRPSQGDGLIQNTFGGFGSNGNQTPQVNNGPATQDGQTNSGGLIQSTFPGFGPGQQQSQFQPPKPSQNDGLISSIFGDGGTEKPQINNEQNASSDGNDLIHSTFAGFGPDGLPISQPSQTQPQPQTQPSNSNDNNDLISGIFGGLPQTNNNGNTGNTGNAAQGQSGGNDLIQSVFPGFGITPSSINTGNMLQPVTEMSPEMKANNDLIESIFAGQNVGTSTLPPTTTNSNGLIYDIDVRSS